VVFTRKFDWERLMPLALDSPLLPRGFVAS